jgi:hypothetical protein
MRINAVMHSGFRCYPAIASSRRPQDHFLLSGRCDRADPAAALSSLLELPFFKTLEAAVPAFLPVFSFFAIVPPRHPQFQRNSNISILLFACNVQTDGHCTKDHILRNQIC